MTFRVLSHYFVAGVVFEGLRVTRTAPILHYMLGWDADSVLNYAKKKGWKVEELL